MADFFKGNLSKMHFSNEGTEAAIKPQYYLEQNGSKAELNQLIGNEIEVEFEGQINCMHCGVSIKKTYGQGYCYPCFTSIPQTEECVFKPELCRAHEGIARDMDYAREHCLTDQYLYLALSGGLKVGITRFHQIPTRWIDQGAVSAIKVAITSNRYKVGLAEVALKQTFADRTNWRKMLTQNDEIVDLLPHKQKAVESLLSQNIEFSPTDDLIYSIEYPILKFPQKIKSIDLLKNPKHRGLLAGIKGQYLIFSDGSAINIRKHGGFNIAIR